MPAAVVTAEPPVKKLLNAAAEFREWRKQKILNEALDFVKSKTLSPKDTILVFLTLVMDNAPGTTVKDVVEALTEQ
jgi:hypothetical protein